MSYDVLGPKQTQRYRRLLGRPDIERIITRGGTGHRFDFRTYDHRHGSFWFIGYGERKGHWDIEMHEVNPFHWTSCRERFPEDFKCNPAERPRGVAPDVGMD